MSIIEVGMKNLSITKFETATKKCNTNIRRAKLPQKSQLTVLPGSSMGPKLPPNDDRYIKNPGSSVDDPIIDQIKYVGGKLQDVGEEIIDGIKAGADDLSETIKDFFDNLF